jgi:hypothetical protein
MVSLMTEHVHPHVPEDFKFWVERSISLLGALAKQMTDGEAINLLQKHGIPKGEANEIVTFLPIAFCRKLLPQVNWPPSYIEVRGESRLQFSFLDNERYLIILNETEKYYASSPQKETILGVAARSAEFHVINSLILQGGNLMDIRLTNSYVIRYS